MTKITNRTYIHCYSIQTCHYCNLCHMLHPINQRYHSFTSWLKYKRKQKKKTRFSQCWKQKSICFFKNILIRVQLSISIPQSFLLSISLLVGMEESSNELKSFDLLSFPPLFTYFYDNSPLTAPLGFKRTPRWWVSNARYGQIYF